MSFAKERVWMEKESYYEILGISSDASQQEIEEILHEQLRKWNYRLNAPTMDRRQEAEKMLEKLEEIKEILLDEEKRRQYDQRIQREKRIIITQGIETKREIPSSFPPSSLQPRQHHDELHEEKKQWRLIQLVKKGPWLIGSLSIVLIIMFSVIGWNLFVDEEISSQNEESNLSGKDLTKELKILAQEGRVGGIQASVGDSVSKIEQELGQAYESIGLARTWRSKSGYSFYEKDEKIIAFVVGEAEEGSSPDEFPKYLGLPSYYENMSVKNIEEVFGKPTVKAKINYLGDPADFYYYQLNEKMAIDFIVAENKVLFFRVGEQKFFGEYPDEMRYQTKLKELLKKLLVEEIKEYAEQGKVYDMPFGIGATIEEVKSVWGEPVSGELKEGDFNYYRSKAIALDICGQQVCKITATQWQSFDLDTLPERYDSLTFELIKEVLGSNYIENESDYFLYTYKLNNYDLTFAVDVNIEKMTSEIRYFSVSKPSSLQTISPSTK